MSDYGSNLRRLMARFGLTLEQVIERSGLDERTVKAILAGRKRPQARTLHRLADGLGVVADEFFQDPTRLACRSFDRATNPLVDEVVATHRELFEGWSGVDFDELYSRFGCGGALTGSAVIEGAIAMNRKREVQDKVALLLESGEGEFFSGIVELLYHRILVR